MHVLGDFAADEAKAFFLSRLARRHAGAAPPALSDAAWGEVHAVCGGNALRLVRAADGFAGEEGLDEGALTQA